MKTLLAAAAMAILMAGSAAAQYGANPPPAPPPQTQDNSEQFRNQERLEAETRNRAHATPSHEEILHAVTALAESNRLSCAVTDASLLGQGTATINGQNVQVHTYEAACGNGLGYFLIDQNPGGLTGFTCFAADAIHAADIAAHREPQPACALPANADVKKMATTVLARLGQSCEATSLRLIGRDTHANAELTEAACTGGAGFVIASPLPGSTGTVSAMSCPDSYRRNVPCRLSSNGTPLVTLDTFKQALAQHHIACTPDAVRPIGRENVRRRHVVEFRCPEQPNGLVAFIPLEDSTAPFEVMDCIAAGNRAHVVCTLNTIH